MNQTVCQWIERAQKGEEEAVLLILQQFRPLIERARELLPVPELSVQEPQPAVQVQERPVKPVHSVLI